jgi:hypothetical protein
MDQEVGCLPVSETAEIFVYLLDEQVDIRRPVRAEHVHGDVYRITDQPYDREVERWEFEPGEQVVCEPIDSDDGQILTATRHAERD